LPINISFLLILLPWTISTHLLFYSSFLSTTTSLPKRIPFIHAKLKKNANKNTNEACVTGEQLVTQIETLNLKDGSWFQYFFCFIFKENKNKSGNKFV